MDVESMGHVGEAQHSANVHTWPGLPVVGGGKVQKGVSTGQKYHRRGLGWCMADM